MCAHFTAECQFRLDRINTLVNHASGAQLSNSRIKVSCPICGSDSSQEIISPSVNVDDPIKLYGAASGIRGAQRIVKCNQCEMIFENPRLPSEKILEGYMHSEDGDHDSQYQMRVRSFHSAIKRNRRKLPSKGQKVLDIGTAGGAFLEAARDFGYDAYGLEPSMDLVDRGNKRGLKIFQGTVDSNGIGNQKFDLICLWDVIEHLPDPRQSLVDALTYLEPNGTLLINFPNIGTVQAKLAGKRFWWIISVHLHHFANETLDQLCESLGLKAVSKKRYFQILEFGYLVEIAGKLGVPLANSIFKILPKPLKKIPIPYYASQTTAIYRANQ